jgi:hypothetical protein
MMTPDDIANLVTHTGRDELISIACPIAGLTYEEAATLTSEQIAQKIADARNGE